MKPACHRRNSNVPGAGHGYTIVVFLCCFLLQDAKPAEAKKEEGQGKKKSGGSSEKDEFPKDIPIEGEYEQFIPASAGRGESGPQARV
jgi:hypothetical protein